MKREVGIFILGLAAGMFIALILHHHVQCSQYTIGVNDALHDRLHPIVHIEDGDTTITYKLQWP